jgi:CRP-like cAMP-binding protein/ActR/RegA family two-component response regulator
MKTVLLIEDDLALRENTAEILELSNYEVITASNGLIGISQAEKYLPDIILCDIMMPRLDGYKVFEKLSSNKNTKYIPFVFLSVKAEIQDIRKGMNLGADDYITKPFTEDDLLSVIEKRLAKASILHDSVVDNNVITAEPYDEEIKTLNDLKNYFDDYGILFEFNKDDIIYRQGEHSNFIYLINKGAVKCYQIDEQGKELVTALYKEDDLFGFTSFIHNTPYKETATAIEDIKLFAIPIIEFKDILNNNHKVVLEIIELLADNLSTLKEQLLQMAYSSVNKKTAATIIQFAEKLNYKPGETIKISRSDLASVAGIAPETFIRALTIFKNTGIIKADGKNFKIVDLEKLKKIK